MHESLMALVGKIVKLIFPGSFGQVTCEGILKKGPGKTFAVFSEKMHPVSLHEDQVVEINENNIKVY